jgi:hypothetical protein
VLGVVLGSLCAQERLPYEATVPMAKVAGQVDVSAILRTWRIKGVMVCSHRGRPRVCLWVENAFPCGVLEVVHQPFRSHVPEAAGLMAALRALKLPLTSVAGPDRGQTNLQFAEARVFTWVPPISEEIEIPIAWPKGVDFRLNYVTEIDAFAWRTGLIDRLIHPPAPACDVAPAPKLCAGRWGAYAPREGYLIHSSEPKAAFLQAVRAGRAASDPAGRFVLSPYPFEPRTGHLLQLIKPVRRRAVRIGQDGPIDEGAGSLHGAYLFIHLGIFEECRRCLPARLVEER